MERIALYNDNFQSWKAHDILKAAHISKWLRKKKNGRHISKN
jgi:hypothetical protein